MEMAKSGKKEYCKILAQNIFWHTCCTPGLSYKPPFSKFCITPQKLPPPPPPLTFLICSLAHPNPMPVAHQWSLTPNAAIHHKRELSAAFPSIFLLLKPCETHGNHTQTWDLRISISPQPRTRQSTFLTARTLSFFFFPQAGQDASQPSNTRTTSITKNQSVTRTTHKWKQTHTLSSKFHYNTTFIGIQRNPLKNYIVTNREVHIYLQHWTSNTISHLQEQMWNKWNFPSVFRHLSPRWSWK